MPDRLETLLAYHREDPDDAFTRFALAQEYLKRGDLAAARALFEALVAEHPDYTGTYYHLGKLYEALEQPEAARDTYRRGIGVAQEQRVLKDVAELQGALLALEADW